MDFLIFLGFPNFARLPSSGQEKVGYSLMDAVVTCLDLMGCEIVSQTELIKCSKFDKCGGVKCNAGSTQCVLRTGRELRKSGIADWFNPTM